MRILTALLIVCPLIFIFVGCQTTSIKDVALEVPIENTPIIADRSQIQLKKVVVKVRRGEEVGTIHVGVLNIPQEKFHWRRGGYIQSDTIELDEAFRDELEAANYEVVGNPDAIFVNPGDWKADYMVAALVKDIKMNLYYPLIGWGDTITSRGDCYVDVEWQIYSRLTREVVLTLRSEGSYKQAKATKYGADDVFTDAFAHAVRNLLAQKAFYNLVAVKPINKMEGYVAPIQVNSSNSGELDLVESSSSVVTIFAGTGSGSGFVLSDDGYILTNQHVVGDSENVRVKFPSGLEFNADVISKNRLLDVAIVKCPKSVFKSLNVNLKLPPLGANLYAMGSPLGEEYEQTISKGIVSGFRKTDGVNYIQSDVAINPGNSGGPIIDENGNVIGLAVAKVMGAEGISFIIPIKDALKGLEINVD
jgi:hypothetical protein